MHRFRFWYLKRQAWFWPTVLAASIIALAIIIVASVFADTSNQTVTANTLREFFGNTWVEVFFREIGVLVLNDAISGLSIALLSSLVSLSLIYIYKVPDMRRIAIQVLATGYFENFLLNVIEKVSCEGDVYRIIIVLPSYELIERPKIYAGRVRAVFKRLGFELTQDITDEDFGRNVLLVQKADKPPLPIRMDVPTTMKMLRKILELESDMPVGRGSDEKWQRQRFCELREEFRKTITQKVSEGDWGGIVFVNGDSMKEFEASVTEIMNEISDELGELTKS